MGIESTNKGFADLHLISCKVLLINHLLLESACLETILEPSIAKLDDDCSTLDKKG